MESRVYGNDIGKCETLQEYVELVRQHQALYADWSSHVVPLLKKNHLTADRMAAGCNVSRACAARFARQIPANRENVIKMAMMMRLTLEQTNDLLTRWAKFQRLYSRNPSDAIWIYLLKTGGSDTPDALFQDYYRVFQQLQRGEQPGGNRTAFSTQIAFDEIVDSSADGRAVCAAQDERFCRMIRNLLPSFEDGYRKLIDFIHSYFVDLEESDDSALNLTSIMSEYESEPFTPNRLFAGNPRNRDLYYRKMRSLEQKHQVPNRQFLIALGLHLGMNTDRLNTMLSYAGMGPLCPKDRLEGTIVFFLEELNCQFPSYFDFFPQFPPAAGKLRDYAGPTGNPAYDWTPTIQMDEVDQVPTEKLSDYIRRRLQETNIFDKDEQQALEKFLEML